jgi:hypothetical protein
MGGERKLELEEQVYELTEEKGDTRMESGNQVYEITEENGNMTIFFKRSETGCSFTIKYHDDLLYKYDTEKNEPENKLVDVIKHFDYSKRFYYFKDLFSEISGFIPYIQQREKEINEKTQDDYPFFFATVFYYLSKLFNVAKDKATYKVPSLSNEKNNQRLDHSVQDLSRYYPQFDDDYELLIENGFIEPQEGGFFKLKDGVHKQFLAEYFHSIKPDNKKMEWQLIEKIFRTKGLANNLSRNGNEYKSKSKDFEKWEEIR